MGLGQTRTWKLISDFDSGTAGVELKLGLVMCGFSIYSVEVKHGTTQVRIEFLFALLELELGPNVFGFDQNLT